MAHLDKFPCHYAFTNLPSIFDEEALTALELCGRLGTKINDLVKAYNNLDTETREKLAAQDQEIIQGLATLTEKLPPYVSEWLMAHPEITTSLQDGEILMQKFHDSVKKQIKNGYVVPEMFGTVGGGDDSAAINAAIANPDGLPVLLAGNYTIASPIEFHGNQHIIINGTLNYVGTQNLYGIWIDGSNNTVTGNGTYKGNGTNLGLCIQPKDGVSSFFNRVTVKNIRDFEYGVLLYNHQPQDKYASYFNIFDGVTFNNCHTGIKLECCANGNKFTNLCFYNCGMANSNEHAAIVLKGYPDKRVIENMFVNISTTNATDCTSILIAGQVRYNQFFGMQFENGGGNARGFYEVWNGDFQECLIAGISDINNQGSSAGTNNTWLKAYGGKNEMPAIKTREQYRPCGFKYAIKKDSSQMAFSDGGIYTIAQIKLPPYAVANINVRGMVVSSAAGDIATGNTANLIVRAKADGSIVPYRDGNFDIMADGWINYTMPDAGVGVAHFTTCFVEFDIITTARDTSKSMTPGHYGVTIKPYDTFKEYKGDW